MKVYMNKYRSHWLSPYRILEKIFFWKDVYRDEDKKIQRLVEILDVPCTWIMNTLDKVHPKIDYVRIDPWDTWGMDHTLAQIILPMLKQLKATKHGVPSEFVHGKDGCTEIPFEEAEKKWDEVMDQMIWSFEQILDEDNDAQFFTDDPDAPVDQTFKSILRENYVPQRYDAQAHQKHNKKIQKGLELFGKHFRSLWD
jgi:hypothetical protein